MDFMSIFQLIIPVITFLMGFFLTNIGYKRDRKLSITREKFEKLYHPFYVLVHSLGTDREDGIALGGDDPATFKPFIDHLTANAYLASTEGQRLIWETRSLVVSYTAEGNVMDEEKDMILTKSIEKLFTHLIQEYMKSATVLGYELGDLAATSTS